MPRRAKELSAIEVKRLAYPLEEKEAKGQALVPVFVAVGGVPGLQLQLTPGGGKSWIYRYSVMVEGKQKRRSMGLGSYPTYSVAEARDRAREAVRRLDEGLDPIKEQKAKRAMLKQEATKPTFGKAVDFWKKANPNEFSSAKYEQTTLNGLRSLAKLQDMYVDQIEDRHIWQAIDARKFPSGDRADRVRGHVKKVFDWVLGERHIEGINPADTVWLRNKIKAIKKGDTKKNHGSLQLRDAVRWWEMLGHRGGMGPTALRFLAMTAVRSGDVRGMTWDEVDFETGIWTIPAERLKIKNKGSHSVPLPTAALKLLAELDDTTDFVFPAVRGGQLSDMTVSKAMKDMHAKDVRNGGAGFVDAESGDVAVPHGLRATFRTWAGENGISREHAEIALAHAFGNEVERAYSRSKYIEQRRPIMEAWADFLHGKTAVGAEDKDVLEFRRG